MVALREIDLQRRCDGCRKRRVRLSSTCLHSLSPARISPCSEAGWWQAFLPLSTLPFSPSSLPPLSPSSTCPSNLFGRYYVMGGRTKADEGLYSLLPEKGDSGSGAADADPGSKSNGSVRASDQVMVTRLYQIPPPPPSYQPLFPCSPHRYYAMAGVRTQMGADGLYAQIPAQTDALRSELESIDRTAPPNLGSRSEIERQSRRRSPPPKQESEYYMLTQHGPVPAARTDGLYEQLPSVDDGATVELQSLSQLDISKKQSVAPISRPPLTATPSSRSQEPRRQPSAAPVTAPPEPIGRPPGRSASSAVPVAGSSAPTPGAPSRGEGSASRPLSLLGSRPLPGLDGPFGSLLVTGIQDFSSFLNGVYPRQRGVLYNDRPTFRSGHVRTCLCWPCSCIGCHHLCLYSC